MPALPVLSAADRLVRPGILPRVRRLAQGAAFWTAILLLAAYPAALLLPDSGTLELVTGLVVTHAAVLLLGHGYDPS